MQKVISSLTVATLVFALAPGLWLQAQPHAPALAPQPQAPAQPASQQPPPQASDADTIKDFNSRVSQYMGIRNKARPGAPKPTDQPEKLELFRDTMRDNIRVARVQARQGDVFTPAISGYFKRQIAAAFHGPHGHKLRTSLRRSEPVAGIKIEINGKYPANVPLQSTPASLLFVLPALPKELQYLIVDHELLLRDLEANLIVDYLPDAFPAAPAHHRKAAP